MPDRVALARIDQPNRPWPDPAGAPAERLDPSLQPLERLGRHAKTPVPG
ncbi:MAG: hypothetical protein ACRDMJ_20035 [Solirubrobacteraceae bacterium]